MHPGEVLKLSCPLPATGTITWTKDGSSLGANNRTLIEQEVLQIRDATPKDSGLYACTSVGKDTICFIVNVTGESGIRQERIQMRTVRVVWRFRFGLDVSWKCVCVCMDGKSGGNRGYSVQMPSRRGMTRTIQSGQRIPGQTESS